MTCKKGGPKTIKFQEKNRELQVSGNVYGSHTRVIILPTQTMHYYKTNLQNHHTFALFHPPPNGSHLMIPVIKTNVAQGFQGFRTLIELEGEGRGVANGDGSRVINLGMSET